MSPTSADFVGPPAPADWDFVGPPAPSSTDWLLPTYEQPGYGFEYIEGGFPSGTFEPQWIEPAPKTDWLSSFTEPLVSFGQKAYEKLPEVLWGYGMEQIRPKKTQVDEGAGVTVIHTEPAHAGGEPAAPISISVPQLLPGGAGQAVSTSNILLFGAGLVVLYLFIRK